MEMKKDTKAVATVSANRKLSNGRVRFSRLILNFFLALLRKEIKQVTVDEVSLDGIFSRIEKEKERVRVVLVKQTKALKERDAVATAEKEKIDYEVKELEREIRIAKATLQNKLAENESAKAEIEAEKVRGEKIIANIDKFYGGVE